MKSLALIGLILGALVTGACGAEPTLAPTKSLPTAVPTEEPPTATPGRAVLESPLATPSATSDGSHSPLATPTSDSFDSPVGLPNPASVFCQEQGYTLELRSDASGTAGYCIFPDGTECEEWAFYRGECAPGTPAP
jgi:putative hemolysin